MGLGDIISFYICKDFSNNDEYNDVQGVCYLYVTYLMISLGRNKHMAIVSSWRENKLFMLIVVHKRRLFANL